MTGSSTLILGLLVAGTAALGIQQPRPRMAFPRAPRGPANGHRVPGHGASGRFGGKGHGPVRAPGRAPGAKPAVPVPNVKEGSEGPAPTEPAPATPAEPAAPTTPAPATPAKPKFNKPGPANGFYRNRNFYGRRDAPGAEPGAVAGEPACSEAEAVVLRSLVALTAAMKGKLTRNVTQMPSEAPQECHDAATKEQLTECYYNWGFTPPAAECYAIAKMSTRTECGAVCGGPLNMKPMDLRCAQCDTSIKKKRRSCVHKAARISEKCTECQHKAYASWDGLCEMSCMNAFSKLRTHDPLIQCRTCNDRIYEATAKCGI